MSVELLSAAHLNYAASANASSVFFSKLNHETLEANPKFKKISYASVRNVCSRRTKDHDESQTQDRLYRH